MYSSRRGLLKFFSISMVVLFGWFGLLAATGSGPTIDPVSSGVARADVGPAATLFPSWVVTPTSAVIAPSIVPSVPITMALPTSPWDTAYVKVGSVLRNDATGVYNMWYESASFDRPANGVTTTLHSAIGLAVSPDGITWSKPITSTPIFNVSGGPTSSVCPGDVVSSWDSSYVGSPRVIYDGVKYRMFYVGSNSAIENHFTGTQPASIGVAESTDGVNWCRAGRSTPILTPNPLSWDNYSIEPAGARMEGSTLKLLYTSYGADGIYRTGQAAVKNFVTLPTSTLTLDKDINNPLKVNGSPDRVKSAYARIVNGTIFTWYVSNISGADLIYQANCRTDLNCGRDPEINVLWPLKSSPNDQLGQVDIASIIITSPADGLLGTMWYTGRSSSDNTLYGFRAISPPPPGAVPPTTPPPTYATPIIFPTSSAMRPTPTPLVPALPPGPSNGGPSAFLTATPGDGNYSPFYDTWRRVDQPVQAGFANRSWIYGSTPYGFRYLLEPYENGSRLVQYYDKARMEQAPNNTVTGGLLVKELISGLMQVGDNKFVQRLGANEAIAGDAIEVNPNNPAYYSLYNVASLNNDKRVSDRTGNGVIETINRSGTVGSDIGYYNYNVNYAYYDNTLGHNIPDVFWNFMNQRGLVLGPNGYANDVVINWLQVMGLPLTEPYWTKATVNGQVKDVLVQAFERRVLTFTPSNPDPFKVEMGNVGRHYFRWRYGQTQ
ncbi:MAG TPA: hypothetical protein VH186_11105 [Chloroflexia bacterium]|nr:hypothetical protein [Chloroflexia bacterium]